jgi:hypothetical protein
MVIIKETRDFIPYEEGITRSTNKGFKILDVPSHVYKLLTEFYDREKSVPENYQSKEFYIKEDCFVQDINQDINKVNFIKKSLLDLHEQWCGRELDPAVVYGIRTYSTGSVLKAHHDRQDTHHIASSIPLGKDAPWNLNIQDHDGQWWGVDVEPGQMIMFESGVCIHGRLDAFKGTYYSNIYAHYTLKDTTTLYKP